MKTIDSNQEFNLSIQGMSCASCVSRVEKALFKLEGVQNASVNLATEMAKVHIADPKITPEDLENAVKKAGYRAKVITNQGDPVVDDGKAQRQLKERNHLVLALILSIP